MCGFACGDPRAVPSAAAPPSLQEEVEGAEGAVSGSGGGAAAQNGGGSQSGKAVAAPSPAEQQEELAAQALALARRGGEAALQAMARQAGPALLQRLPRLWEQAAAPLAAQGPAADLQARVNALHVLAVLAPAVHADLEGQLAQLLPLVVLCLQHANTAIMLAAARCVAALAQAHTAALMPLVLRLLAPLLTGARRRPPAPPPCSGACGCARMGRTLPAGAATDLHSPPSAPNPATPPPAAGAADDARLGALLALHLTASALGLALVPFAVLVVVPLMGRMSDAQPLARSLAARTFAAVVAIMPLAQARGAAGERGGRGRVLTWQAREAGRAVVRRRLGGHPR